MREKLPYILVFITITVMSVSIFNLMIADTSIPLWESKVSNARERVSEDTLTYEARVRELVDYKKDNYPKITVLTLIFTIGFTAILLLILLNLPIIHRINREYLIVTSILSIVLIQLTFCVYYFYSSELLLNTLN